MSPAVWMPDSKTVTGGPPPRETTLTVFGANVKNATLWPSGENTGCLEGLVPGSARAPSWSRCRIHSCGRPPSPPTPEYTKRDPSGEIASSDPNPRASASISGRAML